MLERYKPAHKPDLQTIAALQLTNIDVASFPTRKQQLRRKVEIQTSTRNIANTRKTHTGFQKLRKLAHESLKTLCASARQHALNRMKTRSK